MTQTRRQKACEEALCRLAELNGVIPADKDAAIDEIVNIVKYFAHSDKYFPKIIEEYQEPKGFRGQYHSPTGDKATNIVEKYFYDKQVGTGLAASSFKSIIIGMYMELKEADRPTAFFPDSMLIDRVRKAVTDTNWRPGGRATVSLAEWDSFPFPSNVEE